jgi:hypothetical protein
VRESWDLGSCGHGARPFETQGKQCGAPTMLRIVRWQDIGVGDPSSWTRRDDTPLFLLDGGES